MKPFAAAILLSVLVPARTVLIFCSSKERVWLGHGGYITSPHCWGQGCYCLERRRSFWAQWAFCMESLSLLDPLVIIPVAITVFLIIVSSKLFLFQPMVFAFFASNSQSIPSGRRGEGKIGRAISSMVLESLSGGNEVGNTIPKPGQP